MDFTAVFTTFIIPLLGIGGLLAGIGALYKVRSERRGVDSNSARTNAERDRILTETRIDHETKIIALYERTIDKVQEDNEILSQKVDRLVTYVEVLVTEIRLLGHPVPPMPPLVPTTNGHARDN